MACVTARVPKKLVSMTRRTAFSAAVPGGPSAGSMMPALLISTSRRWPNASIAAAAAAVFSRRPRSSSTACASMPSPRSFAAASPSVGLRAPRKTVSPAFPNWRAISRPMPLFAPVTSAILFDEVCMPLLSHTVECEAQAIVLDRLTGHAAPPPRPRTPATEARAADRPRAEFRQSAARDRTPASSPPRRCPQPRRRV